MTEPNPSNHWDLLASQLGAETPSPKEASRQPSPPPAPPVPAPTPAPRRDRPATAPPAASWDLLASELGVAPPPLSSPPVVPPPIAPPTIVPPAKKVVKTAPAAESDQRGPAVPAAAEDSPNFFDERFDFEEPFDLLESADASSDQPQTSEQATSPTDEPTEKRPRRRRRRRRRGRDSEQRDSREPVSLEADTERSGGVEPAAAEEMESVDAQRPRHAAEEEPVQRRPKRRRSRRGRKNQHGDESSQTGETSDKKAAAELDDDLEIAEVRDSASKRDEPCDDEVAGDRPTKLGFRGIPTWEEAIGMIVDKNLEGRSKRPAGGQHHGRGNRGSRDNRGRGGKRRS